MADLKKPSIIYPTTFSSLLANIDATKSSLATLSNVTSNLNKVYEEYQQFGSALIKNANSLTQAPIINAINNIQSVARTYNWTELVNNAIGSQTVQAVQAIQGLDINNLVLPTPENRIIPKDIQEKIAKTQSGSPDTIYNFNAYKIIFNLEIFLRKIITKYIIDPTPASDLPSKISEETLESWKQTKDEELNNPWIDHLKYDLIDYSDFTDLKKILEKSTSVKLLQRVINKEDLTTITSKLHELEPLRLKVAHSRALSKKEFDTIKFYWERISKIPPKI